MTQFKLSIQNLFLIITVGFVMLSSPISYSYSVFEQRFQQLKKKAESGDKRAQYKMGVTYMRGTSINFSKDKALRWLKKSAAQGYVKAWYRLGQIHYDSKYGLKSYSKAFKWFSKAARKNHGISQYYLALHYHAGKGVSKDVDYALIWANRAKKSGVPDARNLLKKLGVKLKSKQTTRRVVRAGPTPKKGRRKRNDVATPKRLDIRSVLVTGGWNQGDSPSDHIPSHSNKCIKVNQKIRCTSKRLNMTRQNYTAAYKIVSLITNFKARGEFTIKVRRNFIFVLPEDPDDPNPTADIPRTGFEEKIAVLDCKMLAKSHIRCHKADKSVIRFTKK